MTRRERELLARDIAASQALAGLPVDYSVVRLVVEDTYSEMQADYAGWERRWLRLDLWKDDDDQ